MYTPKFETELKWGKKILGTEVRDCLYVDIDGVDYRECVESSVRFWSNGKPGKYGEGLGNTEEDEAKATRTGLLGQMAFAKLFRLEFDNEYRKYGDEYDNEIGGLKVDTKCSMYNSGDMLIRAVTPTNVSIPVDKDIYVATFIDVEDRERGYARVYLVGYALGKDVKELEVERGFRGGGHWNRVVRYHQLRDIEELLEAVLV